MFVGISGTFERYLSNEVRQGGMSSPYFFCIYTDGLSQYLNDIGLPVNYTMNISNMYFLMYADVHRLQKIFVH